MLQVCAWCGRFLREVKPYSDKRVSHGICKKCRASQFQLVKTMKRREPNPYYMGERVGKIHRMTKFCSERLEAPEKFDDRSFRTVTRGTHKITIGCLKGHYNVKTEKCQVGTRAQRILHPISEKVCREGFHRETTYSQKQYRSPNPVKRKRKNKDRIRLLQNIGERAYEFYFEEYGSHHKALAAAQQLVFQLSKESLSNLIYVSKNLRNVVLR